MSSELGRWDFLRFHVRIHSAGAAADAKVTSIVAGMAVGADSIDDLDVLRHGAIPALFAGSVPSPRSARSCARSLTAMRSNSTPCTAGSSPRWPHTPRCCRAPARRRSSMSNPPTNASTAAPSRARSTAGSKGYASGNRPAGQSRRCRESSVRGRGSHRLRHFLDRTQTEQVDAAEVSARLRPAVIKNHSQSSQGPVSPPEGVHERSSEVPVLDTRVALAFRKSFGS